MSYLFRPPTLAPVALVCLLAGTSARLSAQSDTRGLFLPMFGGASVHYVVPPVKLSGGLVPEIGKKTSLTISAANATVALLLLGGQASTGAPIPYGRAVLPLYVTPVVTQPLPMSNGYANLPIAIPNDANLAGVDIAMQAVAGATNDLSVSNLLLANIGVPNKAGFARLAYRFSGVAPKHEKNNVRVYAGDLKDALGRSMPVLAGVANRIVTVAVILDRVPTQPVEIRTGTQQTGVLLAKAAKRTESINLKLPLTPVNVYFHNPDPAASIRIEWELSGL